MAVDSGLDMKRGRDDWTRPYNITDFEIAVERLASTPRLQSYNEERPHDGLEILPPAMLRELKFLAIESSMAFLI